MSKTAKSNYPKNWKLTPFQRACKWSQIEIESSNLRLAASEQNLSKLNIALDNLKTLARQLKRGEVADAIDRNEEVITNFEKAISDL